MVRPYCVAVGWAERFSPRRLPHPPMEARSIIFSVRIASLGLQSHVHILDRPLFGKVLLPCPDPSAPPARFRKASQDYSGLKRFLGRPLFDKAPLLSLNPSARP